MIIKTNFLQHFAEDTNPEGEEKDMNLENKEPEDNKPEKDAKPEKDTRRKPANEDPFAKLIRGESVRKKKPGEKDVSKAVDDDGKSGDKKPDAEKEESNTKGDSGKEKEPEFYEIPYMKDKDGRQMTAKIPVTERDTYLQKGYNYDAKVGKLKQEADKASASLQKAAKLAGFDKTDDYLADLEKKSEAKVAEQIEEAYGDPEKITEILNQHPRMQALSEKERELEALKKSQTRADAIKTLEKEEMYSEVEPELNRMLSDYPDLDPNLAFTIVVGNYMRTGKLSEIMSKQKEDNKKIKESTEKKVLADIHDKERRTAPKGGDTDGTTDSEYHPTESAKTISRIFGVSAKNVARRTHELMKRR
jgi:hypothetical protein